MFTKRKYHARKHQHDNNQNISFFRACTSCTHTFRSCRFRFISNRFYDDVFFFSLIDFPSSEIAPLSTCDTSEDGWLARDGVLNNLVTFFSYGILFFFFRNFRYENEKKTQYPKTLRTTWKLSHVVEYAYVTCAREIGADFDDFRA